MSIIVVETSTSLIKYANLTAAPQALADRLVIVPGELEDCTLNVGTATIVDIGDTAVPSDWTGNAYLWTGTPPAFAANPDYVAPQPPQPGQTSGS